MKVLVVGSGGREHALTWKISQSPLCEKLYCAPGNAGIAEIAECVDIPADNVDALMGFAAGEEIDLVVIGPEAPLVRGLSDRLAEIGIKSFGPSATAARLEGSKGFMKDLCAKYDIPTAAYARFTNAEAAMEYVRAQGAPIVIKADGLAAGKGVVVAQTIEEAEEAVRNALVGGRFGDAGASIVVEEFMDGEEVSYFALVDKNNVVALTSAQDHKAVGEGDTGPNTGGMGAYSPAPVLEDHIEAVVMQDIVRRTVYAMAEEGCPFTGVLFAGLMIVEGEQGPTPKLVEFNVRFGDPECQALMMRLEGDLLAILAAAADNTLDSVDISWRDEAALCVVMAANGYPGSYEKNTPIAGLDKAGDVNGVQVFHAGTAQDAKGRIVANGGRVLGVTALGADVAEAQKRAYEAVDQIEWPDGFCRRDIGWRVAGRSD